MSIGILTIERYPTTMSVKAITATACGFLSDALIKPFMVLALERIHPCLHLPRRISSDLTG